jgi:hypothetical protein
MELGDQIRTRIGAEVLDQMLDDLVEGLVIMARAEAERAARARVPESDPGCVHQSNGAEQCERAALGRDCTTGSAGPQGLAKSDRPKGGRSHP